MCYPTGTMHLPNDLFSGRAAVGLSGGADSVALLLKLLACGLPCTALHFNHGFADEDGDGDESFVRDLCARRGVELIVGRCPESWPDGETKEVFARRHRMAFFERELRRLALPRLFLAHHADDRAENAVLRLARGCGPDGLTSFTFASPFPGAPDLSICRPLLDETHAEQIAYLQVHGESWREDLSNSDTAIPRNAIRRLVVPLLPHFTAGVNTALDLIEEDHRFLEDLAAAAVIRQSSRELRLRADTHPVLARRLLRGWIGGLKRRHSADLLTLPAGTLLAVSGGLLIRRLGDRHWRKEKAELAAPEVLRLTAPGTYTFGPWSVRVCDDPAPPPEAIRLPLPLTVRSRRSGDTIRPGGFTGSRKVQNVLVDLKIPAAERPAYPLFCDPNDRVVYIPGLRPARFPDDLPRCSVTVTRIPCGPDGE